MIAIDFSSKAIADLNSVAQRTGADIQALCIDATKLPELPQVDFVYGAMILHHLEPFADFVASLAGVMKPGAKGFFYENSAMSRLLVWCRQYLVGHLWIPKHGDQDEFPLTPQEIDLLRKDFIVRIEHPEMMFFGLIGRYIFRRNNQGRIGSVIDAFLLRRKWLLSYSYRQDVCIGRRA